MTAKMNVPNKHSNNHIRRSPNDFIFGKLIGEGSFSLVYLAKDIHTSKEYAVKVCEKQQICRERKQKYVKREREALNRLSGLPGFLNLYCTFQDDSKLYYVMTRAQNGTLLQLMERISKFNIECVKFYAAEILLAIEQIHLNNIIHRDLKPENILMDKDFHILIADFGSSQIDVEEQAYFSDDETEPKETNESDIQILKSKRRRCSFVGTAQYVSPEILNGKYSTRSTDLWSFGCIIYQMLSGVAPFCGPNDYLIFQKITKLDLSFPDCLDLRAKDLIERLLLLDPTKRLGIDDSSPYTSIRNHKFFVGIDFASLRQLAPPFFKPDTSTIAVEQRTADEDFPDHVTPGLDIQNITRLMGLELGTVQEAYTSPVTRKYCIIPGDAEQQIRLQKQSADVWNNFAEGELIVKHGFVNKRKGALYVPRKRMLLLTTGPRLIYIDPIQMIKKGEIPWSGELRVEAKNFKMFLIHTPQRIYYLEDPQGYALKWCQAIKEMYDHIYDK